MSVATASQKIQFFSKSGTYTAYIDCNKGDFFQDYREDGSKFPLYASMSPKCVLSFIAYSSRASETVTATNLSVLIGSNPVSFGSDNISTGSVAGFLKLLDPSANGGFWGVEVLDEPIDKMGMASFTLTMQAVCSTSSGTSDTLQASCTCAIQKTGSTDYRLVITDASTPPSHFRIMERGQSLSLKATVLNGGSNAFGYKWHKNAPSGWVELVGMTTDTLVVNEADVDSYALYKCEAILNGNVVAQDVQGIWDAQDPYRIDIGADTADLSFTEGDTSKTITFTPRVTSGDGSQVFADFNSFYFQVYNALGDPMVDDSSPSASYTLTYQTIAQASSDVELIITTA